MSEKKAKTPPKTSKTTPTKSEQPATKSDGTVKVGAFVLIEVESASGVIYRYGGCIESMNERAVVTSCCSSAKISSVKKVCENEKEFESEIINWIMATPKLYPGVRGKRSWEEQVNLDGKQAAK